jgi:alginate O-acetyltransferase complex protein AlgI
LADSMLAKTADDIFNTPGMMPALDAWSGVLAFSGQIFFDFAGYSTCAIGVAMVLGFVLPQNFNYPYAATSFSDFWRRWHITLSTWLRDYLYIPLGGNRNGAVKMYFALMVTMLLGGLWHGANWTFVLWGALHGTYLIVERLLKRKPALDANGQAIILQKNSRNNFLYALFIFMMINITWVFFRAGTFSQAGDMLQSMFGLAKNAMPVLTTMAIIKVAVIIPLMLLFHWFLRNKSVLGVVNKMSWIGLGVLWAVLLLSIVFTQESGSSFIYFQF